MNRVAKRSIVALMLAFILVGGMCLFVTEYALNAGSWVVFEGSPHVYNGVNIGCGVITDRSGELLLDATGKRVYSEDSRIRKATLHWLGARYGYISAPALPDYADEMAGFDLMGGLYGY